jgi:hypothetical protein
MGTKHYGATFNRALRLLRLSCPCPVPVQVMTVPKGSLRDGSDNVAGRCQQYDHQETGELFSFVLYIERGWKEGEAVDTLIHEWAHALDIALHGEPSEHHRDSWGRLQSRCYRAVNG